VTSVRNGAPLREAADAIVARRAPRAASPVGILTADCVPVLAASESGAAVAAIHAGWRGLAAGVLEAGIAALREAAGAGEELIAVVGPHVGACCYEVDRPVIEPLVDRFGRPAVEAATAASGPGRPGHWQLDLGMLAREDLQRAGVAPARCSRVHVECTCCDPRGFASYRRDGAAATRMLHCIAPGASTCGGSGAAARRDP